MRQNLSNPSTVSTKHGSPLALLALCFTLSTGAALATESPIVFGGNHDFPTGDSVCATSGDLDHDGVCNVVDNCVAAYNPTQSDTDADGRGDFCDNCPTVRNGIQRDTDGDGIGDACDHGGLPQTIPSGTPTGDTAPRDFGQKN